MADSLVVIPTYNEKGNIERLVAEIFRHVSDVNVLIVDDNSPDSTGAIADKIASRDARVSVMHRMSGRGRGLAGIDAFREALKRKDVLYIMEMDADFSHDPKYIPHFLDQIEQNDVVIGSRFVQGGRDIERSFMRRFLSRAANFFVRKYLGLDVRDCSSGYRCFKRKVIDSLDLDSIISKGPAIIEEILYISVLKKSRIKEIPITFNVRYKDKTKLNLARLVRVLMDILCFRERHLPEEKKKDIRGLRRFGFQLALALNIAGFIMFYRERAHFVWFTGIGSFNLILAIVYPWFLFFVKKILDFIIFSISRLVNFISLVIVFYLIFTPIGILLRLFRKDLLCQKIDGIITSYWTKRKDNILSSMSYERMG